MRVIFLGNVGAGKSILSRKMVDIRSAARRSLDEVAFRGGSDRRPLQDSIDDVKRWIAGHDGWIIEGCCSDILGPVFVCCAELVFLDPGVDACLAHCRSRPWQPEKFGSRQKKDENLANLIHWVRSYEKPCRRVRAFQASSPLRLFSWKEM